METLTMLLLDTAGQGSEAAPTRHQTVTKAALSHILETSSRFLLALTSTLRSAPTS